MDGGDNEEFGGFLVPNPNRGLKWENNELGDEYLVAFEKREGFHVKGLRKQIHGLKRSKLVAARS